MDDAMRLMDQVGVPRMGRVVVVNPQDHGEVTPRFDAYTTEHGMKVVAHPAIPRGAFYVISPDDIDNFLDRLQGAWGSIHN